MVAHSKGVFSNQNLVDAEIMVTFGYYVTKAQPLLSHV